MLDTSSLRAAFRWSRALPVLLALGGVTGCGGGDGLDRQAVSGSVTLDGAPLASGTIQFSPASTEATTETSTSVTGGKYAFSKTDGPVPGNYKVSISSVEPPKTEVKEGMVPGDFRPPSTKDSVPAKYNTATTLTATVKAGQTGAVDFTLTTK